jgi:hypothetical protein
MKAARIRVHARARLGAVRKASVRPVAKESLSPVVSSFHGIKKQESELELIA